MHLRNVDIKLKMPPCHDCVTLAFGKLKHRQNLSQQITMRVLLASVVKRLVK